jgi:flavorubredoxin
MESIKVFSDLQMFNSYLGFVDLSFNQYLLLGTEPLLIHTGTRDHAGEMLPMLKALLGEKKLSYIFISHFESDECGGLSLLKENFPEAKPICSQVTARQLTGFGIAADIMAKAPGEVMVTSDFKLRFISYPSEMHLWEGLIAFEEKRGLLFSSDLFIRRGVVKEPIINSTLEEEIQNISPQQIPNPAEYTAVQQNLRSIPVKYIIPGHGPCLKV